MLLNLPVDHSLLVEIEDVFVSCHKYNYQLKALIGKFKYTNNEYFAYIIHISDLIQIQSKNGFKNPLFFEFENKLLPVPGIPLLGSPFESNIKRIDLYNSFISRSQILSIFISSGASINNFFNNCPFTSIENSELIALSDRYFNEDDPTPYHYLLSPYCSNAFFDDLPDYESYTDRLYNQNRINDDFDEEGDIYPEYWNKHDFKEKYEENETLADREYSDNDIGDNYDHDEPNSEYFYSEIELAREIVSNIFCISISNNYATFEIIIEGYYQHKECPIFNHPFVTGISAFSGIMSLGIGDFQFMIIEKCPKSFLKRILKEVVNYKDYRIIKASNFFICFNLQFYKGLITSNIFDVENEDLPY